MGGFKDSYQERFSSKKKIFVLLTILMVLSVLSIAFYILFKSRAFRKYLAELKAVFIVREWNLYRKNLDFWLGEYANSVASDAGIVNALYSGKTLGSIFDGKAVKDKFEVFGIILKKKKVWCNVENVDFIKGIIEKIRKLNPSGAITFFQWFNGDYFLFVVARNSHLYARGEELWFVFGVKAKRIISSSNLMKDYMVLFGHHPLYLDNTVYVPLDGIDGNPVGYVNIRFSTEDIDRMLEFSKSIISFVAGADLVFLVLALFTYGKFGEVLNELKIREQSRQRMLGIARSIEMKVLKSDVMESDKFKVAHFSTISEEVAGDILDFRQLKNGDYHLIIGDASSKGVPSVMLVVFSKLILNGFVDMKGKFEPADLLSLINRTVTPFVPGAEYLALFSMVIKPDSSRCLFSSAGYIEAFYWNDALGIVQNLSTNGPFIGVFQDAVYETKEIEVNSGDKIMLFNSGVPEVVDFSGTSFGKSRLREALAKVGDKTADEIKDYIVERLKLFSGDDLSKFDLTLIVLEFT